VTALRPTLDADQANRLFLRQTRLLRWRRQLARHPFNFRVELVGLPAYWCTWQARGSAASRQRVDLLIGALDGVARRVSADTPRCDGLDPIFIVEPRLSTDEVARLAEQALLRLRLAARKSAAASLVLSTPILVLHPYWAYYFPRRGDILDLSLLDAVEGRWAGPQTRLAYLDALIRRQQCDASPEFASSAG